MPPATAELTAYAALTESAGLLDRSERGKLALTGADAKAFLQGQVTNDVESLTAGHGLYAAFLTPKGKMLGDLRVLDAGTELLLDTERVALQGLFNLIRRFSIGYDVQLHKRTIERGLLSLIGPRAAALAGAPELSGDPEHDHREITLAGIPVRAIRTALGVDLLSDAGATPGLARELEARGARPVTEDDADVIRIEHGVPRYGVDLDDTVIPQEAGLNERAVSFTKGCYVGQETVARLFYRGKPNRRLRGLTLSAPAAPGDEISVDGKPVGKLTSVGESPRHGRVALALIRREAPPETVVAVGPQAAPATVVELPFG